MNSSDPSGELSHEGFVCLQSRNQAKRRFAGDKKLVEWSARPEGRALNAKTGHALMR